jgi:outer membrane protein assembly factor BamA
MPWLKVSGGYHYVHALTDEGDGMRPLFTPEETPGLNASLGYDVPRLGLAIDTRPSPGYATRGVLMRGTWSRYGERTGQPYSFDLEEYEGAVLIPILREQFGLMFRALATMGTPDAGSTVPIMFAPMVGSGTTVRGFNNRRFQDNGRLVLNAEYRWRPSRYLDMAIFYDAGRVGPDWRSVKSGKFETGWGVGSRLHGPAFTIWRVELAHSRNGFNLVVATAPPF